ncbi:MAG: type IV pilus assembly protein FimV [Methylococcaceae bacterium]
MPPLITYNNGNETEPSKLDRFFSIENTGCLWSAETLDYDDFLEKLVFSIARKPKCLITHLQRIFFCFHKNLNEQLFAAIVDLMIILNKRGQELSWRMIIGAKSRLSPDQFDTLKDYVKDDLADATLLLGNQYSILSKGLVGVNTLIQQIETSNAPGYDPLEIARDHIEYSQLEDAKKVLEKAILKQPTRQDLHHELLELYQSTLDSAGFYTMQAEIAQSGVDTTAEWSQLDTYFKGRNNNG